MCTLHTIQTYSISWGEDYLIILEIFNTMFGYVFISEFEKNFVILTSIRGKHMHSVVRNIKKIKVLKLAILDSGCYLKYFMYCTVTVHLL